MRPLLALFACIVLSGCPSPKTTGNVPPVPGPMEPSGEVKAPVYPGAWAAKDGEGDPFDMVIFPNGQVATTWAKGASGARGERGFWRVQGAELIAFYDDGWTDVISPEAGGFRHKGYSPGTPLGPAPSNSSGAARVEGDLAEFTGVWRLNKEPDGNYLYIALFSTGRAVSTINGGTEGKWQVEGKTAVCRWPDGWVDVIERGTDGFQKRSWVGGAPPPNAPPDITPAERVGESKFSISP